MGGVQLTRPLVKLPNIGQLNVQALTLISGTTPPTALSLENPLVPELRFTASGLVTLIAQIYQEKIRSDRIREKQDNEPDGFAEAVIGVLLPILSTEL